MIVKCYNCEYEWNYKGKSKYYATCPMCMRKTMINKKIGYLSLHQWAKKHIPKPELCEICGENKKLVLSNKDHQYKQNIEDWQWLCHNCHINYDKELRNQEGYKPYKWNIITIHFEDSEFEELKKIKLDKTWHDFIIEIIDKKSDLLQYLNEKNIEYSKTLDEYGNKDDEHSKANAIYFSAKRHTIKEIKEYIEGL